MFGWLREFLEIRADFKDRKRSSGICDSCETLKMQLAIANDEKKSLLNRLLEKPEKEVTTDITELKAVLPNRHLNWNAKRQALEASDRKAAQILKERTAEINRIPTEDLEKELDIASAERESQAAKG